ncbi:hypothetical protein J6590_000952 [Homalodisca vitripennis]|nr:hypothetical protein J6590_000952 [Homalodisca vitripennis]
MEKLCTFEIEVLRGPSIISIEREIRGIVLRCVTCHDNATLKTHLQGSTWYNMRGDPRRDGREFPGVPVWTAVGCREKGRKSQG